MSKVQLAYILICVVFGTRADEVPSSVDIHQGAVGLPRTDIHVADITTKVEDTAVKPEDSPSVQGHAVVTEKSEHPKIETRVLEAETIAAQEKSDVTTSEDAKTEQVQPAKMEARILTNHITVDGDLMGLTNEKAEEVEEGPVPCTCGVFLSGQFKKGHKTEPKGEPILMQEMDAPFANNAVGSRQCTSKCIETIVKHLPKSNEIVCASVDRDNIYRERAYLFIKNYSDRWQHTNLSAGREFCCRNNTPYKCH